MRYRVTLKDQPQASLADGDYHLDVSEDRTLFALVPVGGAPGAATTGTANTWGVGEVVLEWHDGTGWQPLDLRNSTLTNAWREALEQQFDEDDDASQWPTT